MTTVLLEIGTEEIPAEYMPSALAQLAELAHTQLAAERITVTELRTWGTSRRCALYLTGVAEQQLPAVREVRGPAVRVAFAANGEPAEAAIGFARSQGINTTDLRIKKMDHDEYVVAIFRDAGRPTLDILPTIFSQLIQGLTFPKTMRWGSGSFRFARPIRWIVALMDAQIIPLTVDDVVAGRLTRGHRFLAPGEVEISAAAEYPRVMDENQVVVDQDARRQLIHDQLATIAAQDASTILDDGTLLDETTFRVEYPTAVRGALEADFLSLPREVLLQVLRHEQHFFPLTTAEGDLLPAFCIVRNGDKAYLSSVREGYERVARAKLLDARFFFEQDTMQPLSSRVEALHGVIFQEQLGTMYDKAKRLESLAGLLAAWLDYAPEDRQAAERAALLAKADLVTAMVNEHPALQGTMGSIYARRSGEPEMVAAAIGEQYQPRTADSAIPGTALGRLVALADKLDTIAACFSIGVLPTGSEDPYALRREALGVIRILAEAQLPLSLSQLIARALRQLTVDTAQSREELQEQITAFFRPRLESVLTAHGVSPRVSHVALATADLPATALRRALFLERHLDDPQLLTLARTAGRLENITRGFAGGDLQPETLFEPAECALLARYQEVAPQAEALARAGDDEALLALLMTLAPLIEHFFTDTLVMAEDPELRLARVTLVWHLARLYALLGDLPALGL